MIKNQAFLLACLASLSQSIYPQLDRFNAYVVKIPKENISERVSIALKDNIDLVGVTTTAGSIEMTDHLPSQNAFIVSKVQKSNSLMKWKTNLR